MDARLELSILPQPTDSTCGPTCLHAVYGFFGDELPLPQVVKEVPPLPNGGTLAATLACHALERGYRATLFTYNLRLFDPTWFREPTQLADKLRAQREARADDDKLAIATATYLRFLELGGDIRFEELDADLIRRHLKRGLPVLTGLSATYLYGCARESDDEYDDVRGEPTGHFVVLAGYDAEHRKVLVHDPLADNPGFDEHTYAVGFDRLIGAILLGVLTWDANLLVLEPPEKH